jgi:hypothetical protein
MSLWHTVYFIINADDITFCCNLIKSERKELMEGEKGIPERHKTLYTVQETH